MSGTQCPHRRPRGGRHRGTPRPGRRGVYRPRARSPPRAETRASFRPGHAERIPGTLASSNSAIPSASARRMTESVMKNPPMWLRSRSLELAKMNPSRPSRSPSSPAAPARSDSARGQLRGCPTPETINCVTAGLYPRRRASIEYSPAGTAGNRDTPERIGAPVQLGAEDRPPPRPRSKDPSRMSRRAQPPAFLGCCATPAEAASKQNELDTEHSWVLAREHSRGGRPTARRTQCLGPTCLMVLPPDPRQRAHQLRAAQSGHVNRRTHDDRILLRHPVHPARGIGTNGDHPAVERSRRHAHAILADHGKPRRKRRVRAHRHGHDRRRILPARSTAAAAEAPSRAWRR